MHTIKVKGDAAMRKRFFHESAMSHPAKLHSGLLLEILSRYCPEPCTILDPMAGIGTLMLAAQYGHRVILNELESHFLDTIPLSWAKIQQNGPALGHTLGEVVIIRGDARCLPIAGADCVITSPPWENKTLEKRFASEEELETFAKQNWLFTEGGRSLEAVKNFMRKSWRGYTRPKKAP